MNTITRTHSNSMPDLFLNTAPKNHTYNQSEAEPGYHKPLPVVNIYSADPSFQTRETNDSSDQNITQNNEPKKTNKYSEIISEKDRQFTQAEIRLLEELKKIDTQVRQHEMAHIASGGKYITSGANFTYQRGPDGKNYAVSGEVGIDTSTVPGDPEATIKKMRQVKNAALAPADPSSQDLKVAAHATSAVSKALSELMISQVKNQTATNEKKVFGRFKKAIGSYQKIGSMTEKENSSIQIAV